MQVFNWTLVKKLYREKLINVITEFYNETPTKGNIFNLYGHEKGLINAFVCDL
jgi:hypothetical protein